MSAYTGRCFVDFATFARLQRAEATSGICTYVVVVVDDESPRAVRFDETRGRTTGEDGDGRRSE